MDESQHSRQRGDSEPVRGFGSVLQGVSLIATTLNEADSIVSFLDGIASQSRLPSEIVVVDGGSTDGTLRVLEKWEPPHGVNYVVSSLPGANISRGRNEAVDLASGTWIAITDAGARAERDWMFHLSTHFATEVDVVSGFFAPQPSGFLSTTIASVITPTSDEIDALSFLPSSRSVAIRKSTLTAVGGYPEWLDYCEDLVLDFALRDSGATFVFEPRAIVTWPGRPTWFAFFKQYYRYARGDGKAGLWRRRHIMRYAAYSVGVLGIGATFLTVSPWPLAVVALGAAGYLAKFVKRVVVRSAEIQRPLLAVLLTPTVVVVGDVAKMIGYPVGRRWRRLHRAAVDRMSRSVDEVFGDR